ncbi:hypothetical protein SAMN04488002_1673 [Litoreibacter janthinus]|uniref:Uncharacterized protein n=1 Tax=Litoreibacter janthinus TaxID=670154 RepID=A0A1I6GLT2_9RHOB|nr:hypothetical protein SAMN04488002_1673 [Litoreibacter janthinus]
MATSTPQTFRISDTSQITLTRVRGGRVVEKYLYASKNGRFFTKQTTIYAPNAKAVTWLGWSDLPKS